MSIKATELQIGDWAIHDYYKKPIQIKTIPSAEQIYHPITLTKEILEKNGWKCTDKQIWDSDYYISAIFEYDEFAHSHLALQQFDEFGSYCFGVNRCLWEGVNINYVHELQRALRCCGLWDLAEKFKI